MNEQETIHPDQKRQAGNCVCGGAGPSLSDFLRSLGPSASVREHFDKSRIEFLKGLRAIIDNRIAEMSKAEPKGTKVNVE
ncbi:MAG: hypothetical protein ABI823_02565 [Bryobacteraceae bacterium]